MTAEVDSLRTTLDHLAIDPAARGDKPYLITMLRRLGYSEQEIQAYLGEPQAAAVAVPEVLEESGERIIELEYTGPGLRDFQLVVPVDAAEFDVDDPLGLGAGLTAGTEILEGDPDEEEMEAFLSGESAVDITSEFTDDEIAEAEADLDSGEVDVEMEAMDDMGFGVDDGEPITMDADQLPNLSREADGSAADLDDENFDPEGHFANDDEGVSFASNELQAESHPYTEGTILPDGTVEFHAESARRPSAIHSSGEFVDFGAPAVARTEAPIDSFAEAAAWDDTWPEGDDDGDSDAFWHGDWLLHSREQQREDGSWHRVYFFAKGESPNGTPSALPDGYEVAVNPANQLPYLREASGHDDDDDDGEPQWGDDDRAGDDDGDAQWGDDAPENAPLAAPTPRKRVRIQRVSGDSQEAAEASIRSAGRKVLGSMPVDIREHEEESP